MELLPCCQFWQLFGRCAGRATRLRAYAVRFSFGPAVVACFSTMNPNKEFDMKSPKTEPYQRSRHRAALHAWVVAATAVASIGLPSAALDLQRDNTQQMSHRDDQAPAQDAQRVASFWIDAILSADIDTALSMMHLPSASEHQQAVHTDLDILSELLATQDVRVEPVAHRRSGHWAMSAWSLDALAVAQAPVIEPIALYNPSADGLFDRSAQWRVVPQGIEDDPAIKPLYNADYDALQAWSQTLL